MEEEGRLFEEIVVDLVNTRATGALEVTEDRKRWQFFFEDGELAATRSNLKSEQPDALTRELGPLDEETLNLRLAARRIAHACRAHPEGVVFKAGVGPAMHNPADIRHALYAALLEAREEDELRERVGPMLAAFPITLEQSVTVLTGTPLDGYLHVLDGSRPGQDVLAFAPAEPRATLAALWIGWQLGLIGLEEEPASLVTIGPSLSEDDLPSAPPPQPARTAAVREFTPPQAPKAAPQAPKAAPQAPKAAPPPPAEATPASSAVSHEASLPRRATIATPAPTAPSEDDRLTELARQIGSAKNHFEALGVSWDQPAEAMRAAYMRLARDLHPDRYVGASEEQREQATELFDRVRAAWEELSDEGRRRAYTDRVVHGKKSEDELAMEQVQQYLAAEADFKRGLAAFNNGATAGALPLFQAASEKAPDEVEFRAYYGYTLFFVNQRKDPTRAAEGFRILENAVAVNANQERRLDTLLVLQARALHQRGDLQAARRAVYNALKINAQNLDALRLMRRLQEEPEAPPPQATSLLSRVTSFFEGLRKKDDS